MVEALKELERPYEILELAPSQTITLKPITWEAGRITIHPRYPGAPPEKPITAVRVHLDPKDKPIFPHYYDITATTLVPQIMALLVAGIPEGYAIRIHAVGEAPKKRFQVSLTSWP